MRPSRNGKPWRNNRRNMPTWSSTGSSRSTSKRASSKNGPLLRKVMNRDPKDWRAHDALARKRMREGKTAKPTSSYSRLRKTIQTP